MDIDYKSTLEQNIKGKITGEKQGASGIVYIVYNGENTVPRNVAYKSIRVDKLSNEKKKEFLEECDLWFSKPNNYLLKAFYPIIIDDLPFICMPYYEYDLKSFMLDKNHNEIESLVMAAQISKALLEMRKSGIEHHQDFNPPNIMLENLSEKYIDYPKYNCINYSIKIADFGIADLIKRIGPTNGGGGGKFPFKAPEQYSPKEYQNYNPDIFSLGVITYMLLTNTHPNGLDKAKALNKTTSSSNFKKWCLDARIKLDNQSIQNIINQSLQKNPLHRPSAEEFHNILMLEILKLDKKTYTDLKFKLDFYDNHNSFNPILKEISTLSALAEFTHNKTPINEKVLSTFQKLATQITTEEDVIRLSEYYTLSTNMSFDINIKLLTNNSLILIDILFNWYSKIKVHHKYPSQDFNGQVIQKTPDYRDFEITAEYIGIINQVLQKSMPDIEINKLFVKYNDDIFISMLIYSKAIAVKDSDIKECISLLKQAKKINEKEPVFDYMIYCFITFNSILNKDEYLDKIKIESFKELKKNHQYWDTIKKLQEFS
jgi:serine/threonine protein kinase